MGGSVSGLRRRLGRVLRSFDRRRVLGDRRVPDEAGGDGLVRHLQGVLSEEPSTLAVVGRAGTVVGELRRALPGVSICRAGPRLDPSARHVHLTAKGPFDVLVDTGRRQTPERLLELFYHVRPGGYLVLVEAVLEGHDVKRKPLAKFLEEAERFRRGEAAGSGSRRAEDAQIFADYSTTPHLRGRHLIIRSEAPSGLLAKFREGEGNAYLRRDRTTIDSSDRILESVPAVHFTSRCVLRDHSEAEGINQPSEYDAPEVTMREYHDAVVTPAQVVTKPGIALPDCYRHNQGKRLMNRYLDEVAPRFTRLRHSTEDLEVLEGTFFHLDNEVRGHFGHLLTEQVSRMWAWPSAKERYPEIKALVTTPGLKGVKSYEYAVYEAAGIDPDDVVLIDRPKRIERLLSAAPMLSNPHYVHPAITDTWRRIGDHLAERATGDFQPERIFCSRRIEKRACTNTAEVEALFAAQDFAVIYPEDHSLGDQVALFRNASVVGGFAGSGVFQLEFVMNPKRVILVASERYTARNEYLMASVLGHEIDQVTCRANARNFQSDYTFDHEREGVELAKVFATLPPSG